MQDSESKKRSRREKDPLELKEKALLELTEIVKILHFFNGWRIIILY